MGENKEIEENLLRLLDSGVKENILLAFQLQQNIQSPLFEERVKTYQAAAILARRGSIIHTSKIADLIINVGNIDNIKEVKLRHSKIDSVPNEIGSLVNLENVSLTQIWHKPIGKIPDTIGKLKKLKILEAERCELSTIPESIANLTQLEELNLSFNPLGIIPDFIKELQNLTSLSLYDTALTSFPTPILSLNKLRYLNLASNKISSLPDELFELKNLEVLDLRYNELTEISDNTKMKFKMRQKLTQRYGEARRNTEFFV
jgi:Leucine-rich repeat (LRR) protein